MRSPVRANAVVVASASRSCLGPRLLAASRCRVAEALHAVGRTGRVARASLSLAGAGRAGEVRRAVSILGARILNAARVVAALPVGAVGVARAASNARVACTAPLGARLANERPAVGLAITVIAAVGRRAKATGGLASRLDTIEDGSAIGVVSALPSLQRPVRVSGAAGGGSTGGNGLRVRRRARPAAATRPRKNEREAKPWLGTHPTTETSQNTHARTARNRPQPRRYRAEAAGQGLSSSKESV